MGKYLYLVLFLLVACGKEVNISNKALEKNSSSSSAATMSTDQDGVLIRGIRDQIKTSDATYYVSMYSSYSALEFIAAKPLYSQQQVNFRGKKKNNEMIIEVIEPKELQN